MIIAHRPSVGHSTVMRNMYKQETELAHRVVKSAGCKAHIVVKSAPLCSAFGWDWLNLQICSGLVNLWVKLHKQFWFFFPSFYFIDLIVLLLKSSFSRSVSVFVTCALGWKKSDVFLQPPLWPNPLTSSLQQNGSGTGKMNMARGRSMENK